MLKHVLSIVALAVLVTMPAVASASVYTLPIADLVNSHLIDQGFSTTADEVTPVARPIATYSGNQWVQYNLTATGSEAKVGIGDSFDWNSVGWSDNAGFGIASLPIDGGGMGDLTTFNSYGLMFYNSDPTNLIAVDLFMNTGWVDGGVELNNYYESGWVTLAGGQIQTLTLDFTSVGAINLNHVSNIGFQVAIDNPAGFGVGTGEFQVDVAPIPEPASILVWCLLGAGSWLGMRVWRRRRIPVGRQPWSNENRTAIHEIVDGR